MEKLDYSSLISQGPTLDIPDLSLYRIKRTEFRRPV
jgi:hypothetical protein